MEQKQRRNSKEWADIFADWRKSGESQRGYCRNEGISFSSFSYWRRKLEKQSNESLFVRVGKMAALPGVGGKTITARIGGVEVELSGEESEAVLVRVFRALKAVS